MEMTPEPTGLTDHHNGAGVITPCQMDPDGWFPDSSWDAVRARRFCDTCPVKDACLRAAMDHERGLSRGLRHGIWGGTTPTERAQLEAERTAA